MLLFIEDTSPGNRVGYAEQPWGFARGIVARPPWYRRAPAGYFPTSARQASTLATTPTRLPLCGPFHVQMPVGVLIALH